MLENKIKIKTLTSKKNDQPQQGGIFFKDEKKGIKLSVRRLFTCGFFVLLFILVGLGYLQSRKNPPVLKQLAPAKAFFNFATEPSHKDFAGLDTNIVSVKPVGGGLQAQSLGTNVIFPANVNGSGIKLLSVETTEAKAEFSLAEASVVKPSVLDSKKVTYGSVYPGVDVVYRAFSDHVKEDIVLNSAKAQNSFVYQTVLPVGTNLKADDKGGLLAELNTKPLFYFYPLSATDSKGTQFVYHYETAGAGGGVYEIKIVPDDPAKLAAGVYPLTIDPTLTWDFSSLPYTFSNGNEIEIASGVLRLKNNAGIYATDSPYAVTNNPLVYSALSGFSETPGSNNQGTLQYQLSKDKLTWYWYGGSSWVAATSSSFNQSNTASIINTNISAFVSQFGGGSLYIKVFLHAPTNLSPVELTQFSVGYNSSFMAPTIATIFPATGPAAGETNITITGTNFVGAISSLATFASSTSYAARTHPLSATTGDFNGDGKLDLVVANQGSDNVSVFLGTGNGSFGTKVDYTVGVGPFSVTTGDFNGDGKLDLAVANNNASTISILLGTGTGSFGAKTDFVTGSGPRSVVARDFNGDGKLDLATANYATNNVSILLGTGTGSFGTKVDYAAGTNEYSLNVGDFNGDGKLDLVEANLNSGTVSVLLGTGGGAFGTSVDYAVGTSPDSIAVGDFNGDGKLDLVVSNYTSSNVSVLLGTGTGSFGAKVDYAIGVNSQSVVTGDFNGDGKLDLATADYAVNNISVFLGTGTGSFGPKSDFTAGTNPFSIIAGDFNGDGKLDLATPNYTSGDVSVLLNTFAPAMYITIGGLPVTSINSINSTTITATIPAHAAGQADVTVKNADGQSITLVNGFTYTAPPTILAVVPSSVLKTGGDTVTISGTNFTASSTVTFGGVISTSVTLISSSTLTAIAPPHAIGTVDIVVTNSSGQAITLVSSITFTELPPNISSIVPNNGSTAGGTSVIITGTNFIGTLPSFATFATSSSYITGTSPNLVVVGDFNGDGKLDLATANYATSNISILLGTGTGTFGTKVDYAAGTGSLAISTGDFNGDGKLDLAVANDSGTVSILLGTGTGTFGTKTDYGVGTSPRGIVAGDFNGDGKLDLAVANAAANTVSILLGTGTGTFGTKTDYGVGTYPMSVTSGDFNGDGKLDLAAANANSNNVSVLLGTDTGAFGTKTDFAAGTQPFSVTTSDFNGDGKLDLAVAKYGANNVSVLLGTGTGAFGTKTDFAAGTKPYSVTSGDFNGDGKLDLATANSGSNNVSIFIGTGTGTFGTKTDYAAESGSISVTGGDFNGDGKLDLAVANFASSSVSTMLNTSPSAMIVSFAGIAASNIVLVNSTTITATVPAHAIGSVDVTVKNADGQSATVTNGFTYLSPLSVTSVNISSGNNNSQINNFTITGTGFKSGTVAKLSRSGQTYLPCTSPVVASTTITCSLDLRGKSAGAWDVVIVNPDLTTVSLPLGFTINSVVSNLVITTSAQTIKPGIASGAIIIKTLDTTNTSTPVSSSTTINLQSITASTSLPSLTGEFSMLQSPWIPITSVTLNAGEFTKTFYYKDITVGHFTLAVQESPSQGWALDNQTITVDNNASYFWHFDSASDYSFGTSIAINNSIASLKDLGGGVVDTTNPAVISATSTALGYSELSSFSEILGSGNQGSITYQLSSDGANWYWYNGTAWTVASGYAQSNGAATINANIVSFPVQVGWGKFSIKAFLHAVTTTSKVELDAVSVGFKSYPYKYVFLNAPLNISQTDAGKLTVEARDLYGNVFAVTNDIIIGLSSSAQSGFFARNQTEDLSTRWNYNTAIFPAGQTQAVFYYKDEAKGTPIITVTGEPGQITLSAQQKEIISSQFRFLVTGITDPIKIGVPSSVTIQAVDSSGQPMNSYIGTVHFTSTDGAAILPVDFNLTASMLGRHTFVNGVMMLSQGAWCVNITDTADSDITGSQCAINTTPPNIGTPQSIKIITNPQTIAIDGTSTPITIQFRDASNTPVSRLTPTIIHIYSDSATAVYSVDGETGWSAEPFTLTIPQGASSVNFFYHDSTLGTHALTVSDDSVKGEDFGFVNDAQSETVSVGLPYRYTIFPLSATTVAGTSTPAFFIGLRDSVGNSVVPLSDLPAFISAPSGLISSSLAGPWANKFSEFIPAGQSGANFYYQNNLAGSFTVTVSDSDPANLDSGLADARADVTVKAAQPAGLAFSTQTFQTVAGQTSPLITVSVLDSLGNQTSFPSDTVLHLASNSSAGQFSASAEFASPTATLTIPAGQSSATFYYKDLSAGNPTITASINGLTSGQQAQTVLWGDVSSIKFSSVNTTVAAGQSSDPIVATTFNIYGINIPVPTDFGISVGTTASSTGRFDITPSGSFDGSTTTIIVPQYASSSVFYYKDTKAAQVSLTGKHFGMADAAVSFTVAAAAAAELQFTPVAGQTMEVGQTSQPIAVVLQDVYHNVVTAQTSVDIALTTTSQNAVFLSATGTAITGLRIFINQSQALFTYKDFVFGAPQIFAHASGLTDALQAETIVYGNPVSINLQIATTTLISGMASLPITLSVKNSSGEIVPSALALNIALTGTATTTGNFDISAAGAFNGSVTSITLPQNATSTIFFYKDSKSGGATITAAKAGLSPASLTFGIGPAGPHHLSVISQPQTLQTGEKSQSLVIQLQDPFNNPIKPETPVFLYLHSDSSSGMFLDNAGNVITSGVITTTSSTASIYYRDLQTGSAHISISDNPYPDSPDLNLQNTQADFSIIYGSVAALRLTAGQSTVSAGQASGVITINTLNTFGQIVPVSGSSLSLDLRSTNATGIFALASSGPFTLTQITIPLGQSQASVYYQNSEAGSVTVRALVSGTKIGKTITLTNPNNTALTDYQAVFTMDTASLISAHQMRGDGGDIRFTSSDGQTQIPYWVESGMNTASTRIWVRIPLMPASADTTINMTYGSFNLLSQSNKNSVFVINNSYPDFTGWSNTQTSVCGYASMMGGYGNLSGGSTTGKTVANLPAGQYQISFNYYQIDGWNGESGVLYADGRNIWSRQSYGGGSNICGTSMGDSNGLWSGAQTSSVIFTHSGGSLNLAFGTTANQNSGILSFGVDNIIVRKHAQQEPVAKVAGNNTVFGDLNLEINAASVYRLAITNPNLQAEAGAASDNLSVQFQDQFGNAKLLDAPLTIYLAATDGAAGGFATSTNGVYGLTQITANSGVSAVAFFYKDTKAGVKSLTVSASGMQSVSQDITIVPSVIDHLNFLSPAKDITVLKPSEAIILGAFDRYNNSTSPVTGLNIALSSQSAHYEFSASTTWSSISTLSWPAQSQQLVFYYQDWVTGNPTVTVANPGGSLTAITQTEHVFSADLTKLNITSEPQVVVANTPSGVMSFMLSDRANNEIATSVPLSVTITSDNSNTQFSEDFASKPWQTVLSIVVAPGETVKSFYFQNSAAGLFNVSVSAGGLSSASQQEQVIEGTVGKINLSTASSTAAGLSVPIVLQTQTSAGAAAAVTQNITFNLTDSLGGSFSLSSTAWVPVTFVTLPRGFSSATVYYRSLAAGSASITATAAAHPQWTAGVVSVNVASQNAYRIAILSGPTAISVNLPSTAFALQLQDQFGNVSSLTLADTSGLGSLNIYLYGHGQFSTSTAVGWGIAGLPLNVGENTANFYYQDSAPGPQTITASEQSGSPLPDTGWLNSSWNLTVSGEIAASLRFTTLPQSAAAGTFGKITLEADKADGSPSILGQPLAINLSSNWDGGEFVSIGTSSSPSISSITIPAGQSSVDFYGYHTVAGSYNISATANGLTGVSQSFTVIAGLAAKLVIVSAPQTILAGQESLQYHAVAEDVFGNIATLSENKTIGISSNDGGVFSLSGGTGWQNISTTTLVSQSSDLYFYFKNNFLSGSYQINIIDQSSQPLSAASQQVKITPDIINKISIVSPAFGMDKGQTSPQITYLFRDQFGNSQTLSVAKTIYFYSSSTGASFSTSTDFTRPIVSLTLPAGIGSASFYYKDSLSGNPQIVIADEQLNNLSDPDSGWTNAHQTETVAEGNIYRFVITFSGSTFAGSGKILTVALQNQNGLPVAATTTMAAHLFSSSQFGRFSLSSSFLPGDFISFVNFLPGEQSKTVYYRDTLVGSPQLTASDYEPLDQPDIGIVNAKTNMAVIPADLYSLNFISQPQTLEAGEISKAMTVQLRDSFGNTVLSNSDLPLYIYSSSASAQFASSSSFSATTTLLTVPAGASSIAFFYKDMSANSSTITVSDQQPLDSPDVGLVNASQVQSVSWGNIFRIAFVGQPQNLFAGQVSDVLTVQLQNRFNVPVPVSTDTPLYLTSSAGGQFAILPGGPFNVTSVIVPSGKADASFYFRKNSANDSTMTVSETSPANGPIGWLDASQSIGISAGEPSQIVIASSPAGVVAHHPSNAISIQLRNSAGIPTAAPADLRLYLRSSANDTDYDFAADPNGPWGLNFVTLKAGDAGATVYYRDTEVGTDTLIVSDELPQTEGVGLVNGQQVINITPQTMDHFLITNISDPQIQGSPSSVVVVAQDPGNFVVSAYSGDICFSDSDGDAILPSCYTYMPAVDQGLHTFGNGVAFLHSGEKWVKGTDSSGRFSGLQTNITVLSNNSGVLTKLQITNIVTQPMKLNKGVASNPITVQMVDSNEQPVNAPPAGFQIHLTSSSDSAMFAVSPNGPWSLTPVFTIPANLSSLNIYYKDSKSGLAVISISDWQTGNDSSLIVNASLQVSLSGLDIQVAKVLESHNSGTLAMTENPQIFMNSSGANLVTTDSRATFTITVNDDITGKPLSTTLNLIFKDAWGNVKDQKVLACSGTCTFVEYPITANIPVDSGNWELDAVATALDGRVGNATVLVPVSPWRIVMTSIAGFVQTGASVPFTIKIYNNGVLADPADFSISWADVGGRPVTGLSPVTLSQFVKNGIGDYFGTLPTSNLVQGDSYHALISATDAQNDILAQGSHADIQVVNNPALAPKNFTVEKILTSTPPSPETYDLKFSWVASDYAETYQLYRSQNKYAKLFDRPCSIAQVQNGDRTAGSCDDTINMEVNTQDEYYWVLQSVLNYHDIPGEFGYVPGAVHSYIIKDAQNLPGNNYFFILRANNGITSSGLSSMIFVSKHQFNYNSLTGVTNYNWFSVPYSPTYFTNQAAGLSQALLNSANVIAKDVEGGLGSGANQKINTVSLWNPVLQNVNTTYYYRGLPFNRWQGIDFPINPGDSIYIQPSGLTPQFSWTVLGNDKKISHNFTYNSDAGVTNYNWISLPYSGMYKKASDVVSDIEGSLGSGADKKINAISLWNPVLQNVNTTYYYRGAPFNRWQGIDFPINPGDGIYIQLSGITPNFTWTPALLVEPNQ